MAAAEGVKITWEMVGGITALIAVVQTLTLFVIRAIVRDEVAKLNGTYVRRGECALVRQAEQERYDVTIRRLERLEEE